MLFNSTAFLLFFPTVLSVYLLVDRRRPQNFLLLLGSYFFYGCWDWRFLCLIWISTLVDYRCALAIAATDRPGRRKAFLLISVISNLGILGFFKYFNFFAESARSLLGAAGFDTDPLLLQIILPVGISFYTFQTMSYTIDVYRGEQTPTHDLLDFALYVCFFPQLVAGPIERADRLLPQMETEREVTWEHLFSGARLMGWGLFKKVAVADTLAPYVNQVFGRETHEGAAVLLAVYAFAFQIYCDFSGYSDIARGAARCMGFELMVNFRRPYFAFNIRDFWRRWHISLSSWLRDYVYIPFGGNRWGRFQTYRNLLYTMLLGGLWHGASWTFVVWGGYHGLLLGADRYWTERTGGQSSPLWSTRWMRTLQWIVFWHLTCLGWLFFRAREFGKLKSMCLALASPDTLLAIPWGRAGELLVAVLPLLAVDGFMAYYGDDEPKARGPWYLRWAVYAFLAWWTLSLGASEGQEFIYFQF